MQNLNPVREVARRGRDLMIIGAFVLLIGLIVGAIGVLTVLLFSSPTFGLGSMGVGALTVLTAIAVMVRGLSLRTENEPAKVVAQALSSTLGAEYTFIRNVSRRGLGYIDAVLVGPPGALVFRIHDKAGVFTNEGATWLIRGADGVMRLARLNLTRECVADVFALRAYLAKRGLAHVPVYAIVVFTHPSASITVRQPNVPVADLRSLLDVMRSDYLRQTRIDPKTVEATVKAIYE
ncbi:MAG: hypothetical protein CUN49_00295 [Candidatus Thermofonsia Clade 1 bacterium]|uniref:NERD domain-containing protein n=1 Tax=Candidatus Thermofonsia Clade 1 bacterium TaxID=2364210 RepID=A0A2M8PIW4_9CHLR|nr:MAG: hypothetical protein CUN49_00295 [Candidatus Thermofonsia Clade 1 bacterium]RMF51641.1 MAG: NERD domain-containing protein [Chloroflexota bacterium]